VLREFRKYGGAIDWVWLRSAGAARCWRVERLRPAFFLYEDVDRAIGLSRRVVVRQQSARRGPS
jgi:hypothetical protein